MRWRIAHGVVLDMARRELRRDGEPVRAEPKVLDLIALLAQARGAVVSKPELTARLWPDCYVSPSSLRRLVKEARRALGADGHARPAIVTLHGRGYRLGVHVEEAPAEGPG